MKLTKHFSAEEFVCPCGECDGGEMDPAFMLKLEALREKLGFEFHIDSGARCQKHNDALPDSAPNSMHVFNEVKRGRAADIGSLTVAEKERIVKNAYQFGLKGIGIGSNWVHVDDREVPACWTYPRPKKK